MSSTLPRPLSPIPPSPVTGITFNQHLADEDEEEEKVLEPSFSVAERLAFARSERQRVANEVAAVELEVETRLLQHEQAALLAAKASLLLPLSLSSSLITSSIPLSTPVRQPLVQRRLPLSAVSRTATAATVAHQQSIDALPDVCPPTPPPPPHPSVIIPPGSSSSTSIKSSVKAHRFRVPQPSKFTGTDEKQNKDIEPWTIEMNTYMVSCGMDPSEHLQAGKSYFSGSAITWLQNKEAELLRAGKVMTWQWLQDQLINDFGRANGATALRAEYKALRMGSYGDRPTRTVRQYTDRFVELMRALTTHEISTLDIATIDNYVEGIRCGYEALYVAMKGADRVVQYDSLIEARDAALLAESHILVDKTYQSSSNRRGPAQSAVRVNNTYAALDTQEENPGAVTGPGEGRPVTTDASVNFTTKSPSPPSSSSSPKDGRHRLTDEERNMLMSQKRCFRCYGVHLFGFGHPRCSKPVQKQAPRSLN
jgi:hypothetical protein